MSVASSTKSKRAKSVDIAGSSYRVVKSETKIQKTKYLRPKNTKNEVLDYRNESETLSFP